MATRDTYEVQQWENLPSKTTPVSAERLAHIEQGIKDAMDNRALNELYGDETINLGRKEGSTVGYRSVTEGIDGIASAREAHAEGSVTTASGVASHSEGEDTIASGYASHAEGCGTVAGAYYAHAEGLNSQATGSSSHAEGEGTGARGNISHAEGKSTQATGANAHAEGDSTLAQGNASHTEGYDTKAYGLGCHAEGSGTVSGYSEETVITGAHAEGRDTKAVGQYSHAEGYNALAAGISSHAEGGNTGAYGNFSHAEGDNAQAYTPASHAEGAYTISNDYAQHVGGKYNVPGMGAVIIGGGTSASDRKNIHTLDWTGNAYFAGDVSNGVGVSLNSLKSAVDNVAAIAEGASIAKVFDTKADLEAWLAVEGNAETLIVGQNIYIKATDTPDYWWDGTDLQVLETEKVEIESMSYDETMAILNATAEEVA